MFETEKIISITDIVVGIIGIGFVGDALKASFSSNNITVHAYDKFKKIGSFDSATQSQILFLALPTLYKDEIIGYDKSALCEVSARLQDCGYKGLVIIKSTVEPGTTDKLADIYNLKFIHNPEFLTARTARIDFDNQSHVVLGKSRNVSNDEMQVLSDFYSWYYPKAEISCCLSSESEAMKIMVNTFYAAKVQIFNEFYLYCNNKEISYNIVKDLMIKNGWINPMHTTVPGPDGKLSYGGACFPKDSSALLADMKRIDSPHMVLTAIKQERDLMRATQL